MIESVNDLSLSVYMLIRHTGRKYIELKSERELQVPEVFVVFLVVFLKWILDFFKHLIKFNNDMFNSV